MSGDLTRLRSFMDAAHLRQRAIAGNMSNANTPGYQRVEVRFEEAAAHARRGVVAVDAHARGVDVHAHDVVGDAPVAILVAEVAHDEN